MCAVLYPSSVAVACLAETCKLNTAVVFDVKSSDVSKVAIPSSAISIEVLETSVDAGVDYDPKFLTATT